ncbi:uncharacterized protein MELLADRAFT_91327 [Melampsora larici-populina 98AG31]|uniref:Secreted protein n=1 Tax=Melampsora larici-populina (strain 98AG31 / pathotype 3-4-7) TaxID=747676 RepID=F4RYN0_MELLP|nr:uncharacterized protein MELLADRAFT_91327 [Melampsora larici-populina 98AG31]EGG02498.1 secreted protein [Melampsora larici-populina 98AG31]
MRINHSFVVASMALLFVLEFTNTNTVSANSGGDGSGLIRVLRRRSLSAESPNTNEETTQGEPIATHPVQQSGVPQLGLSAGMIQLISTGLVRSIAKFSADKEAGVEFPTQQEMTQAIDQALWTSDSTNSAKVAQAIKNSIDALADRKLAEGETGRNRTSKVSKPTPPSARTSSDQIAAALLQTIHAFCEDKAAGGRLPTATEVNKALTPALQSIDFGNVKKGAGAVKFGLDQMGTTHNSENDTPSPCPNS